MDELKWLVRKYPKSCGLISEIFNKDIIRKDMIERKYIPVILKEDVECKFDDYIYKSGTIFLFKITKEYDESSYEELIQYSGWTGDFVCYGLFGCEKGYTSSGYHHIDLSKYVKYEELN